MVWSGELDKNVHELLLVVKHAQTGGLPVCQDVCIRPDPADRNYHKMTATS